MDIKPLVKKQVAALAAYEIEDVKARVKLDAMENPYPLPDGLRRELAERLADTLLNLYPDPQAKRLKSALADYIGVPAENMLLGNGSDEIIGMIISAFGDSPGLVAYPQPTFSMYGIIAKGLGQETLEVPLTNSFDFDFDSWLRFLMKHRPKVLFIANPNNPTGFMYERDKLRRVVAGSMGVVVVDEAYHSFAGQTLVDMIHEHPNLIVMRTLSKIGLAGLRLGVMVAGRDVIREVNKVRLPYNINSLSQAAAEVVLGRRDVLDRQVEMIVDSRGKLYNGLAAIPGVKAYPSWTNFILFRVPGASRIYEGLKARGILIRNLDQPGEMLADCLRVTVGTEAENAEFLAALGELVG